MGSASVGHGKDDSDAKSASGGEEELKPGIESSQFAEGDKVLAYHGLLIYEAKVSLLPSFLTTLFLIFRRQNPTSILLWVLADSTGGVSEERMEILCALPGECSLLHAFLLSALGPHDSLRAHTVVMCRVGIKSEPFPSSGFLKFM